MDSRCQILEAVEDALRLVSKPELRHRNLRGIYMRVVEGGEVAAGDAVEMLSRSTRAQQRA